MRKLALAIIVCALVSLAAQIEPQSSGASSLPMLAPTPPMGWNSWDSYGTTVREEQVKANADVMAAKLKKYGWQYVTVDIQWYEPNARGHDYKPGAKLSMDAYGRLTPAENRFPSAGGGNGFKPLAEYIHDKGLKFGIHIMRGIPRQAVDENTPIFGSAHRAREIADRQHVCQWNPDMYGVDMSKPGAQEYYDSIAALYASWGVDFIKADDMSRPYDERRPEVIALSEGLRKTGRAIVLSLSPGPAPLSSARELERYAQMWRISDDFWDDWKLLKQQFNYTRDWAPYIGVNGTWPDADMLPIGKLRVTDAGGGGQDSKFTQDEQRTLLTLWSIFRSPLIIGGDLPTSDAATFSLITNPEVIAVDQRSSGNREALSRGNIRAWVAKGANPDIHYVAVFNLGDEPQHVELTWADLGISSSIAAVRDLWERRDLDARQALAVSLRAHASGLYRVSTRK